MTGLNKRITQQKRLKNNDQKLTKESVTTRPSEEKNESRNYRFGPMPHFKYQRMWTRCVFILGLAVYTWYTVMKNRETTFVKQSENVMLRSQMFSCDPNYSQATVHFPRCVAKKCGRFISDALVTPTEVDTLLALAKKGFALGESDGGASILDLHSGALSKGKHFINVFQQYGDAFLSSGDIEVYQRVRQKIKTAIVQNFRIEADSLYSTYPTFFSKLTAAQPKTMHDEYWHIHVDKETYPSFHYTSLLYLNNYGSDFKGGRFLFVNSAKEPARNVSIEPKQGRVSMFSSGAENPHFVEPVLEGVRYAITISFTCNQSHTAQEFPKGGV